MDNTEADLTQLIARSLRISEPLNRRIKSEGEKANFSYANTLLCLCAEVLSAFGSLAEARSRKQVRHAAWASRNLLELSIWCEYCVRSESNAQTFFFDTTKDALGFVNAFASLASMAPSVTSDACVANAKERLGAVAKAHSLDLDDEFKRVHKAAKELGKDQEAAFRYLNTILSKLTHPTAFVVNINIDDASNIGLVDMSYQIGLALARASLSELEKAIPPH
ncbi:MAG: hypothetical protein JST11_28435 [Acidobacteria bacterium]|nr:hypothetical protein [Acidobacteriota bacterium]